jgi:hypothetical protein
MHGFVPFLFFSDLEEYKDPETIEDPLELEWF